MTKVFFTDLHTRPGNNLLDKMLQLAKAAGIENIDFHNKLTAVKLHFGEPGNLAFIRHNYAQHLVRFLRERGAKVFLTDANTLYSGSRSNAVDHLQAAFDNGFNPLSVSAPVIIADGLNGTDEVEMPVVSPVPTHCRSAKIGSAVAKADIIISMTHFKGHEQTGFGGCLKNLGMGAASVGGKLDLHSTSTPRIYRKNCVGCRVCVKNCRYQALALDNEKKAVIDSAKCVGCGQCVAVCQYDAAQVVWNSSTDLLCAKISEYSQAIVYGKPQFHLSFIMDISPMCDCWGNNDVPIAPNIGMAASLDPVALDQACVDLVNQAVGGEDIFRRIHPNVDWNVGLAHAQDMQLGSRTYELVTL